MSNVTCPSLTIPLAFVVNVSLTNIYKEGWRRTETLPEQFFTANSRDRILTIPIFGSSSFAVDMRSQTFNLRPVFFFLIRRVRKVPGVLYRRPFKRYELEKKHQESLPMRWIVPLDLGKALLISDRLGEGDVVGLYVEKNRGSLFYLCQVSCFFLLAKQEWIRSRLVSVRLLVFRFGNPHFLLPPCFSVRMTEVEAFLQPPSLSPATVSLDHVAAPVAAPAAIAVTAAPLLDTSFCLSDTA